MDAQRRIIITTGSDATPMGARGKLLLVAILVLAVLLALCLVYLRTGVLSEAVHSGIMAGEGGVIDLSRPRLSGTLSVEEALARRRSIRSYADRPLHLQELAQLLWAAQGITDPTGGRRTAPSAGALYPLEIYAVVGEVEGVPPGVWRYLPRSHQLVLLQEGNVRDALCEAAVGQSSVREAPVSIVITGVYARTTMKYGERGERYVHMEAGHAGQNIYLQAESLGLGTVSVGAFHDAEVRRVLGITADETPLYIMPVGAR